MKKSSCLGIPMLILVLSSSSLSYCHSMNYNHDTLLQTKAESFENKIDSAKLPEENQVIFFGIKEINDIVVFTDLEIDKKKYYRVLTAKTNLPYYCDLKNFEFLKPNDYILIDPSVFRREYFYLSRWEKNLCQKVIKVLDSNISAKYSLDTMIYKFEEDCINCGFDYIKNRTMLSDNMYFEEMVTNQFMVGIIRIRSLQKLTAKTFEKSQLTELYIPFAIPICCGSKW